MGVWNAYWVLGVDRYKNLALVLMEKTLFPEVDELWWHFSLFSKSIVVYSLRLSQDSIVDSEIFLLIGRKYLTYALGVRVNFMVIWSDGLEPAFVGLMGLDSLFGQVIIGMQAAAQGIDWSYLSGTEVFAWHAWTVLVFYIFSWLVFALYHANCCGQ